MSSSSTDTMVDVTMPQMGVSVSEGTVVQWRKQAGDWVAYEETLLEISTDKIDTEVPSPAAGRLAGHGARPVGPRCVAGLHGRGGRRVLGGRRRALALGRRRVAQRLVRARQHVLAAVRLPGPRVGGDAREDLDGPVVRVATPDVPIPFSPPLEQAVLPSVERVREACRELLEY